MSRVQISDAGTESFAKIFARANAKLVPVVVVDNVRAAQLVELHSELAENAYVFVNHIWVSCLFVAVFARTHTRACYDGTRAMDLQCYVSRYRLDKHSLIVKKCIDKKCTVVYTPVHH